MTAHQPLADDHGPSVTGPKAADDLVRITFQTRDGVTVAAISGEVDVSNGEEVARALANVPSLSLGLVVDLRDLSYLDSTGIALLHDLSARMSQRSQQLVVVCPPDSAPRRVIELTALDAHTMVHDQLDPAVQALLEPSDDLGRT
jgi:anti-anti-sigma factor